MIIKIKVLKSAITSYAVIESKNKDPLVLNLMNVWILITTTVAFEVLFHVRRVFLTIVKNATNNYDGNNLR